MAYSRSARGLPPRSGDQVAVNPSHCPISELCSSCQAGPGRCESDRRRSHAVLRVNELELRKLKDLVGKDCTDAAQAEMGGQCTRMEERNASERHRLLPLAIPGLGQAVVDPDERDKRSLGLMVPGDTAEHAVARAAQHKEFLDAHGKKKAPWKPRGGKPNGRGRWRPR